MYCSSRHDEKSSAHHKPPPEKASASSTPRETRGEERAPTPTTPSAEPAVVEPPFVSDPAEQARILARMLSGGKEGDTGGGEKGKGDTGREKVEKGENGVEKGEKADKAEKAAVEKRERVQENGGSGAASGGVGILPLPGKKDGEGSSEGESFAPERWEAAGYKPDSPEASDLTLSTLNPKPYTLNPKS